MQNNKATEVCPDFKALLREFLGLDPESLAFMDPGKAYVAVGLHEFMRATIERAIGALWAPEGTRFQHLPDSSTKMVRRRGWGDTKAYNLSIVLAHALVNTPRRVRGLSYLPLCTPETNVIGMPRKVSVGERKPTAGLVAAAVELFAVNIAAPGPGALQSISIYEQIQERLGLSAEGIARPCYQEQREAADAVARDPEGQAISGLAALLMSAFQTYQSIIAQEDTENTAIRLLITDDARYTGFANARYSNVVQLLLAGLLAEDGRDLAFVV